jgi:CBS domain-containing protein
MTAPPATISSHATAYDAMLAMAMHRIRHLVIVDAEDKIAGVVSERDLFAMQRIGLRNVRKVIEGAADIDELARAAGDVRRLCLNMLAQGVNAEKLTQFISGLNDSLTRRVIEIAQGGHDFGRHRLGLAGLRFGRSRRADLQHRSGQRHHLRLPAGGDVEALRQRFLAFAKEVNEGLARCGFPLCKGNIMASNPSWCLSQRGMARMLCQVDPLAGARGAAERHDLLRFPLRCSATTNAGARTAPGCWRRPADAKVFLRFMAENAVKATPPLGMIRDFVPSTTTPIFRTPSTSRPSARVPSSMRRASLRWRTTSRIAAPSNACAPPPRSSCWAATTSTP